jgi:hypothetical protein
MISNRGLLRHHKSVNLKMIHDVCGHDVRRSVDAAAEDVTIIEGGINRSAGNIGPGRGRYEMSLRLPSITTQEIAATGETAQ